MRETSPSKLPAPVRWGLLALLGAALACGQRKPELLTATPESVALIKDAKERCAKIASVGVRRLEDAEDRMDKERALTYDDGDDYSSRANRMVSNAQTPRGALDEYLKNEAAADLAMVDRANDLARGLLPKVTDETSQEVAQAVQALLTAEEQYCLRARKPRPSAENYQENMDFVTRDYNKAEATLQGLFALSATDAQFALRKHSTALDQARYAVISRQERRRERSRGPAMSKDQYDRERQEWEAVQQMQEQQQAQHETAVRRWREREEENGSGALLKAGAGPEAAKLEAPPEKRGPSMQAWYAEYTRKVEPVRAALGSYVQLRRSRSAELRPVCQELLNATAALVADPGALDAPEYTTSTSLKKAYAELQEAAQYCANGQNAEAAFHLGTFEGAMKRATRAMSAYHMTP